MYIGRGLRDDFRTLDWREITGGFNNYLNGLENLLSFEF